MRQYCLYKSLFSNLFLFEYCLISPPGPTSVSMSLPYPLLSLISRPLSSGLSPTALMSDRRE